MLPGNVMTGAHAITLLWHTRLQGGPFAAGAFQPYGSPGGGLSPQETPVKKSSRQGAYAYYCLP